MIQLFLNVCRMRLFQLCVQVAHTPTLSHDFDTYYFPQNTNYCIRIQSSSQKMCCSQSLGVILPQSLAEGANGLVPQPRTTLVCGMCNIAFFLSTLPFAHFVVCQLYDLLTDCELLQPVRDRSPWPADSAAAPGDSEAAPGDSGPVWTRAAHRPGPRASPATPPAVRAGVPPWP